MDESAEKGGFLQTLGEGVGNFLSGIPQAINSFFAGVSEGAGMHGFLDWVALILGIGLLLSAIGGFRRARFVGPIVSGAIGVALMGWAVT